MSYDQTTADLLRENAELKQRAEAAEKALAEATATPDKPHWWALVAASAHVPDGARLIQAITTDYNRMQAKLAAVPSEEEWARLKANDGIMLDLEAKLAEAAEDTASLNYLISWLNESDSFCEFVNAEVPKRCISQLRGTDTQWRAAIRAARGKR